MGVERSAGRAHVLVVGAGVAGLEFVLALAERAPDRADVEVVAPESGFGYRPFAVAETIAAGPGYPLASTRRRSWRGRRSESSFPTTCWSSPAAPGPRRPSPVP
jgi:glycine/D-amino acid oxidase-like deaminating enzyme